MFEIYDQPLKRFERYMAIDETAECRRRGSRDWVVPFLLYASLALAGLMLLLTDHFASAAVEPAVWHILGAHWK